MQRQPSNRHAKYRKKQTHNGLVRYEFQVKAETKARFEAMCEALADEFATPWDKRQRMAKARTQIFDEVTNNVLHRFSELQSQIHALKAEISALSPAFNQNQTQTTAPIPSAITSLPDDPQQLKALLGKLFTDLQQANQQKNKYQQQAKQFLELYEAQSEAYEELIKAENTLP